MNAVLREINPVSTTDRLNHAIARLRRRQLELALTGQVTDSARYARRVARLLKQAKRPASARA